MSTPVFRLLRGFAILFAGLYAQGTFRFFYPFSFFYYNTPARLPHVNEFVTSSIRWTDMMRNCEDALLDEKEGLAFFSCNPNRDKWNPLMGLEIDSKTYFGAIWAYKYGDASIDDESFPKPLFIDGLNPQKSAHFNPLGIGWEPATRKLYVVNHGPPAPWIDIFRVNGDATKMNWVGSIEHELVHQPNSIVAISDHEVYFTNSHHYAREKQPIMAQLETFLRIAKGNVVYHNTKTNETRKVVDVHWANGITRLNQSHIAVGSTVAPYVHIFEMQPDRSLNETFRIRCDFHVDNVKTSGDGKLLIAGHPHFPTFMNVAKNNHLYDLNQVGEGLDPKDRPRSPSWVAEWDGDSSVQWGRLRNVYIDNGEEYGTSTSMVRDGKRGVGFVVGLYEKGVLMFEGMKEELKIEPPKDEVADEPKEEAKRDEKEEL